MARENPEENYNTPEAARQRLEALAATNGKEVNWDKMLPVKTDKSFSNVGDALNGGKS